MKHRFTWAAILAALFTAVGIAGPALASNGPTPMPSANTTHVVAGFDAPKGHPQLNMAKDAMQAAYEKALSTTPPQSQLPTPREMSAPGQPAQPQVPLLGGTGTPCITPSCGNLTNHGGNVQHRPQVYVLFWGSFWSGESTYSPVISSFAAGLCQELVAQGAHPDTWSTTITQYYDSTSAPSFYNGCLGLDKNTGTRPSSYIDTNNPPNGVTQGQLGAEAEAFANSIGLTASDYNNTQIAIFTGQGVCPENFAGISSICPNGNHSYCAYHIYQIGVQGNIPFLNIPYAPDDNCTPTGDNKAKYTAGFGHEYAETMSSPFVTGWYHNDPGGEIADECPGYQTITLNTGTFTVQSLYSNVTGDCVYNSGPMGVVVNANTSHFCLNDPGAAVSVGTVISVYTCNGSYALANGRQLFTHMQDGRLRVLGRCIEDTNNGGSGSLVELNNCNTTTRQIWTYFPDSGNSGYGEFKKGSPPSSLCLDNTNNSTTAGTQTTVSTCQTPPRVRDDWTEVGTNDG